MADGLAEQCGTVLLCYGEKGDFKIKRNELLHYHLAQVSTGTTARTFPCLRKLFGSVNLALTVTATAHQRLDDAGETDCLGCLQQFLVSAGIFVVRGFESEFGVSQFTDCFAVHGEIHSLCTGNNLNALLFAIVETFCTDGLNLGHNDIGLNLFYSLHQCIAIEHTENTTLVCHLHGGCSLIAVTSHHILSFSLAGNDEFLTEFA